MKHTGKEIREAIVILAFWLYLLFTFYCMCRGASESNQSRLGQRRQNLRGQVQYGQEQYSQVQYNEEPRELDDDDSTIDMMGFGNPKASPGSVGAAVDNLWITLGLSF